MSAETTLRRPGTQGESAREQLGPIDRRQLRRIDRGLPPGALQFFIDGDPSRGLNLDHFEIAGLHEHIDKRLPALLVRPEVRNQELLDTDPFFARIGITTTEQLSEHMVRDRKKYHDKEGKYYLPFPYLPPNDQFFANKRYNWDTDTHIDAVLGSELDNKFDLAMYEMRVSKYIFDCWGFVINGTAEGLADRTQPPLHTRMIRKIWDAMTPDQRNDNQQFFDEMWQFAQDEYWTVWNALDPQRPLGENEEPYDILKQNAIKDGKLFRRYGHKDGALYDEIAGLATGHDKSKETFHRETDFSRISLEMYLYAYERDFAEEAKRRGNDAEKAFWEGRQQQTKERVMTHHKGEDWFYHYDFVNGRQSSAEVVTGFLAYPLVEDQDMRARMRDKLAEDFLYPYGLALTTPESLRQLPPEELIAQLDEDPGMQTTVRALYDPQQWEGVNEFLNIPPQIVDALIDVRDFREATLEELELATTVMERVLIGQLLYAQHVQTETGVLKLPEKLRVDTGTMGGDSVYPDQDELLMPSGTFKRFTYLLPKVYSQIEERKTHNRDVFVAPAMQQL